MDINKIFGAFGSSSRDDNGFEQPTFLYTYKQDEENHPRYYIRMFTKLILNYTSYSRQLIDFFGKSDPGLDVIEITQTGESMLYNRAYQYIIELDIHDEYHIKVLFEEVNPKFKKALDKSLKFLKMKKNMKNVLFLKSTLIFLNFSS